MGLIFILIPIVTSTLIWPVNRWAMRHGGRASSYTFWLALSSSVISGIGSRVLGENLFDPAAWIAGSVIAVAFVLGFCAIIMHCLRIGPTGPTAAVNNMGLIWPVILGMFWPKARVFNAWLAAGILLVVLSLVFFGFRKSDEDRDKTVSGKWAFWILLGWILSGISMCGQYVGALCASRSVFALAFAYMSVSCLLLLGYILVRRVNPMKMHEFIPGVINGLLMAIGAYATFKAMSFYGAEIVFPFTVAVPILLVLILGHFVYHERIGRVGWLASLCGVGGLVALSLGQK